MQSAICLFVLAALGVASHKTLAQDIPAPVFEVSLQEPAATRWTEPVTYVIETYGFDDSFQHALDYMFQIVPEKTLKKLEPLLEKLEAVFPAQYAEEIDGIHGVLASLGYEDRISKGELAVVNLIYELTVFCTSIVSRAPGGEIVHGRNLDYGITGLQNLTATINFLDSSGSPLFSSSSFVGYVGVLTGMNSQFSVSVDQREMVDQEDTTAAAGMVKNLISAVSGGSSVGMFLRDQLEQGKSFADTLEAVKKERMIAPVYIMMGGLGGDEAAVVTRDRVGEDEENGVWTIDEDNYWRLETNYDHWIDVPSDDNRRDPANACMAAAGEGGVSVEAVRACLSEPPVLNKGTIYTTLMSAKEGYYDTIVRDPELV